MHKKRQIKFKKKPSSAKNQRIRKGVFITKVELAWLSLLIIATIISFSPIFSADFVNWDDTVNILNNKNVQSLTLENITAIFSEHVIGNYNPLSILSFAIEYHFVGENAFLFHLDNLLLHIINILLVFYLGKRLNLGSYASLFLAALFAIQPMRVESVAWITERKDVLFSVFYFSAIHTYLSYRINKQTKFYVLSLALMLLSLLSKIQAVSLPLSLLLIDMYMNDRTEWLKWIKNKIPYFLLSVLFGLLGIYFLSQQGSLMSTVEVNSYLDRLILSFYGIGVYLIKSIIPYEMVVIYPYSQALYPIHYGLGMVGFISIIGMVYLWFTQHKAVKFGLYFFLVNIVFLLQFVSAGQGLTADRFSYVPYFGCFFLLAYAWEKARENQFLFSKKVWGSLAILMILIYGIITYNQTQVWENSETLWTHQLKSYDRIPLPYANRANYKRDQGPERYQEALKDYNKSLELAPRRALTRNSRGRLFFNMGQYQKALEDYNIAVEEDPHNAEYLSNKGAALGYLGRYQESLSLFSLAIAVDPTYHTAYTNRAFTSYQLGRYMEAYQDFLISIKNEGPSGQLYSMLARCSYNLGIYDRALQEINQAIALNNIGDYYIVKATILNEMGRKEEAAQELNNAIRMGAQVSPEIRQKILSR